MRDNRQGLTDEQFAELAKRRDARLEEVIGALCTKHNLDRANVSVHVGGGHSAQCYCACPEGPCQHDWSGPGQDILNDRDEPCGHEATCARCGMGAMSHDLRFMP